MVKKKNVKKSTSKPSTRKRISKVRARWSVYWKVAASLTGAIICILALASMQIEEGRMRMIVNYPCFHLFLIFLLPVTIALFFSVFDRKSICYLFSSWKRGIIAGMVLAIFLVSNLVVAYKDIFLPEIVPCFFLENAQNCEELDRRIRKYAKGRVIEIAKGTSDIPLSEDKVFVNLIEEYQAAFPKITETNYWTKSNNLFQVLIDFSFFNISFAIVFMLYLVYIMFLTRASQRVEPSKDEIVILYLTTALLCLWFPLRFYSIWYSNFYSFNIVDNVTGEMKIAGELPAVIILAAIAAMILILGGIRYHRTEKVRNTVFLFGIVTAIITVLSTCNPNLLFGISNLLMSFDLVQLATLSATLTFGMTVGLYFVFADF